MAEGVNISFQRDLVSNLHRILTMLGLDIEIQAVKDAVKRVIDEGYPLNRYATKEHIDKNASYTIGMQYVLIDLLNNDFGPLADNIDGTVQNILHCTVDDVEDETHQAMEAAIHNLNTLHSRAGAQVPFSSINFGMDTSDAGRLVNYMTLRSIEEGMGNGETPIFPVSIFVVKDGVNFKEGDPSYDLYKYAMKVTAKRLYPNFEFLDAPFNLQYYVPGKP